MLFRRILCDTVKSYTESADGHLSLSLLYKKTIKYHKNLKELFFRIFMALTSTEAQNCDSSLFIKSWSEKTLALLVLPRRMVKRFP